MTKNMLGPKSSVASFQQPSCRESSHKKFMGFKGLLTYLPTANMFPKVNNNANLMGLAKTINDCRIPKIEEMSMASIQNHI